VEDMQVRCVYVYVYCMYVCVRMCREYALGDKVEDMQVGCMSDY